MNFAVTINNPFSATGGIKVTNSAEVSVDQTETNSNNNIASDDTPITAAPELAITKADDGSVFKA